MNDTAKPQPEDIQPEGESQMPDTENAENTRSSDESAILIDALKKKLDEATDKMLRAVAEADNTRKRLEKERIDTAKFAVSSFARDMLTVADNLRRALSAMTPEMREKNPDLNTIAVGVDMTERELLNVFERNNIKKIDPIDQKFDPNLHEVIFESDITDKPPGTVIQVVEQGYTIHDRLLRPARVGVAKGGSETAQKIDQEV